MNLIDKTFLHLARKKKLNWMPDEEYLKLMFHARTGKKLNLKDPRTFGEKQQWLKLHDRNPEYITLVDKFEVKKYVAGKLGEEHVIPNLGVWDKFDDIDFDSLPDQFVLKCTHDSGGLVVCKDKSALDMKAAKEKIERSLARNYFWSGREWPYKDVKPRIIAEKFMSDSGVADNEGLTDYKFYCFNGEPKFLYISRGLEHHPTARISFLTLDWNFAPYERSDFKPFEELPEKPSRFDDMIEMSRKLAEGKRFVRVDLYQIGNEVFFSELTFFPCGGMMPFRNPEHDKEIGEMLHL
ncbi:MAG: glycosyl transferase [Clostridia bacterium]|nr:glycosyl transferase [Clostridia bacterium]